jgi:hypothetical protein
MEVNNVDMCYVRPMILNTRRFYLRIEWLAMITIDKVDQSYRAIFWLLEILHNHLGW